MPTAAQEIAALKRQMRQIEERLEAIERPKLEQRLDKLEQTVKEGFSDQKAVMDVLLKQRADDRVLADQRHAEVMAQFEKLQAKPTEN
jgi:hypothetical protein